jgi:multidrug efflux pump subunit AcrB
MFAVTLMYFTDITLNVISLSGLALAVGMLVDNSIVVIENIYRLRQEGITGLKGCCGGYQRGFGSDYCFNPDHGMCIPADCVYPGV